MKKIIQIILVGIMIVPVSLNAHDTKTIIGLIILIVHAIIFLPILFALVESVYSALIKNMLKVSGEKVKVCKKPLSLTIQKIQKSKIEVITKSNK